LSWRPISQADLSAVVALADQCWLNDGGLAFLNVPENLLGRYFPESPGVGIGAFDGENQLAACVTVYRIEKNGQPRALITGQVRPDQRGQGIGSYLMDWSEFQAGKLPRDETAENLARQISTENLTEPAARLYKRYGYESRMEENVMRLDFDGVMPDKSLPPEVELSTWRPDLTDIFFQTYQAAFRERPGFPGYSADQWIQGNEEDENFKPEWSLLALINGRGVAFVTAGTEHPGGFISQVGVVPEERRRGLCSALILNSMERMQVAGENQAQLTVNTNNPGAFKAYARLGFAPVGRRARYLRHGPL
jgi:ribosomal protein S18 acetylase RimI-like enzyme